MSGLTIAVQSSKSGVEEGEMVKTQETVRNTAHKKKSFLKICFQKKIVIKELKITLGEKGGGGKQQKQKA